MPARQLTLNAAIPEVLRHLDATGWHGLSVLEIREFLKCSHLVAATVWRSVSAQSDIRVLRRIRADEHFALTPNGLENGFKLIRCEYDTSAEASNSDDGPAEASNDDSLVVISERERRLRFYGLSCALTNTQFCILECVARAGAKGVLQVDLARHLRMSPKSLFTMLRQLDRMNVIIRCEVSHNATNSVWLSRYRETVATLLRHSTQRLFAHDDFEHSEESDSESDDFESESESDDEYSTDEEWQLEESEGGGGEGVRLDLPSATQQRLIDAFVLPPLLHALRRCRISDTDGDHSSDQSDRKVPHVLRESTVEHVCHRLRKCMTAHVPDSG
ncbi:MAG: hypothetical protein MHM6MM_006323, partial [Cercozoa sp. M6MM]